MLHLRNFIILMLFGFNLHAQTNDESLTDYCNVSGGNHSWSHLQEVEAAFIRSASKVTAFCFLKTLPGLEGEAVNVQDINGDTALILLMKRPYGSSLSLVETLVLNENLDFTVENNDGISAIDLAYRRDSEVANFVADLIEERSANLIYYIQNLMVDDIRRAVLAGADPGMLDENGDSALMLAARTHYVEVIKAVLSSSTTNQINYRNPGGKTALMESIFYYRNFVALLNDPDLDLNIPDLEGNTALHLAIKNKKLREVSREVIKTLIKMQSADVTATNNEGHTPLSLATSLEDTETISSLKPRLIALYHDAIKKDDKQIIETLTRDIENAHMNFPETGIGEVFDSVDSNGFSVLMNAISNKTGFDISFVNELTENDQVDLDYTNPETGSTALILASQIENFEAVSAIVDRATREILNAQDNSGFSPIMYAAKNGNADIARELLDTKQINFSLQNSEDKSVWDIARESGNAEISDLLATAYQENIDDLLLASESGDMEMFDVYKNGINLNVRNEAGKTPLIIAAENGNTGIVSILLELDVEVNAMTESELTPLIAAAKNNHPNTARALLENPDTFADLRGEGGKNALMWAFELGHFEVVSVLYEHNADFNIKDKVLGNTAVMFGVLNERTALLRKVFDMVAPGVINLGITNDNGSSASSIAQDKKLFYTAKLLEKYERRR